MHATLKRALGRTLLIASILVITGPTALLANAAPPPVDRVNQVNGDGYADLVVVDAAGRLAGYHNGALVNPGGVPYGERTWVVGNSNWTGATHIAAGDINGDGYADLVAANSDGSLVIYNNGILVNPDGLPYRFATWTYRGSWQNARHFAVADVTGDRYADLVFVDADGALVIYVNGSLANPDGNPFTTQTWRLGDWSTIRNLALTDVNRDGYADIVAVAANGELFGYNNGTLVNPDRVPFRTETWRISNSNWTGIRHLTAGDVNRDGYGDLIGIEAATGDVSIYNNGSLVNPGGIPYATETWHFAAPAFRNIA